MTQMEVLRRRSRLRWKRSGKLRFSLALMLILGIALGLYSVFVFRMRPLILDIATNRVRVVYTRIINNAVMQTLREEDIGYDDMVYFEKDYEGKITALCTNTSLLNMLSSRITETVLEKLDQVDTISVRIPLSTVSGPSLLAGFGPVIKLKIVPADSLRAKFGTGFAEAGINQTLHRIVYSGEITCSVLFPGISTSCETAFSIVAAETVIVGGVPQSYTYFSGVDDVEEAIDYYYNYQ